MVVSSNADRILGKMTEFQERVSLNDYHIVAAVESWTTDDLRDSELYLDGYDMYREDKKPGKGGGILLYVKIL